MAVNEHCKGSEASKKGLPRRVRIICCLLGIQKNRRDGYLNRNVHFGYLKTLYYVSLNATW